MESRAIGHVKSKEYNVETKYHVFGTADLRVNSAGYVVAENGTGTAEFVTGDQTTTITYPLVAWLPLGHKKAMNNSLIMTWDDMYEISTPENKLDWKCDQVIKIYLLPPDKIYFVSRYDASYRFDSDVWVLDYKEEGTASRQ